MLRHCGWSRRLNVDTFVFELTKPIITEIWLTIDYYKHIQTFLEILSPKSINFLILAKLLILMLLQQIARLIIKLHLQHTISAPSAKIRSVRLTR